MTDPKREAAVAALAELIHNATAGYLEHDIADPAFCKAIAEDALSLLLANPQPFLAVLLPPDAVTAIAMVRRMRDVARDHPKRMVEVTLALFDDMVAQPLAALTETAAEPARSKEPTDAE